jgi:hypothetical protein
VPVSPIKVHTDTRRVRMLRLKLNSSAGMQTLLSIDRGEDEDVIHQEEVWREASILGDVVALSSAMFCDPDGQDVSDLKFTSQLNKCHTIGFAVVLSVDSTNRDFGEVELLCPSDLPQARGCCFLSSNI